MQEIYSRGGEEGARAESLLNDAGIAPESKAPYIPPSRNHIEELKKLALEPGERGRSAQQQLQKIMARAREEEISPEKRAELLASVDKPLERIPKSKQWIAERKRRIALAESARAGG